MATLLSEGYNIVSNVVVVISPINKYSNDNCGCDVPYWRI